MNNIINNRQNTAQEIYGKWDLKTGDHNDILSALEEAYLAGALQGGMDTAVFNDALYYFDKEMKDGKVKNIPRLSHITAVDSLE